MTPSMVFGAGVELRTSARARSRGDAFPEQRGDAVVVALTYASDRKAYCVITVSAQALPTVVPKLERR